MEIKRYDLKPNPREIGISTENSQVYVKITIGNGQVGGTKIQMNETDVIKGDLSTLTHLGNASELKDKPLTFRTNVLDVNQSTNNCIIVTEFLNENQTVIYSKTDTGDASQDGIASFIGSYVVRLLSVVFAIFFHISGLLFSQNDVSFQALETPASPGFILLDQTPSAIERPTTPQGFGVSVLGLFSVSGGAMEVAPYWLTNHKNLSAEDMYKKHGELIQNFAVSAAHVVDDSVGFVSFGVRTRLFQTYSQAQVEKLDSIKKTLKYIKHLTIVSIVLVLYE